MATEITLSVWFWRERRHGRFWTLLLNALMWSGLIEIDHIGFEEAVELLLMEDQKVIQAFSPDAP